MTMAAAPSPKIIRDGRTLPILSENFSTQTTQDGPPDLLQHAGSASASP